jgi:hypothetical protein
MTVAQHVWEAYRRIVARRDGYRCVYCRVPTAATIEHVTARSKAGGSAAENLALACPWCNTHKGDRPLEEFLAAGLNRVPAPDDLGLTVYDMLTRHFGVQERTVVVSTGSTNAKLAVRDGEARLLVRAGSTDAWQQFRLGAATNQRVAQAAYDFLAKHYTPSRRRRRRPPKRAFRRKR